MLTILNAVDVKSCVNTFSSLNVCPRNAEYVALTKEKLKTCSVHRHNYPNEATIRHVTCPIPMLERRCGPYTVVRSSLAAAASKTSVASSTSTRIWGTNTDPHRLIIVSKRCLAQIINNLLAFVKSSF